MYMNMYVLVLHACITLTFGPFIVTMYLQIEIAQLLRFSYLWAIDLSYHLPNQHMHQL